MKGIERSDLEFFHGLLKLRGSTSNDYDVCTLSGKLACNSSTHAIRSTSDDHSLNE